MVQYIVRFLPNTHNSEIDFYTEVLDSGLVLRLLFVFILTCESTERVDEV